MEIKSFDTILTGICDWFDSLISPKVMSRSNTNIIYLMFKAISKGFEVINNVCFTLNNKFNPANCSEEDLESVASIVGTEKLKGSATGLVIDVTNTSDLRALLTAGFYSYALDDDVTFTFEVIEDTYIESGDIKKFIAFSDEYGTFSVTAQDEIDVVSENIIPPAFSFSCEDNSSLLGTEEETNLEFRKRILTDTDRQNSIVELQTELRNQPYIFDARIIFNNSLVSKEVDGITIPSYYMAIFYSGAPRNELAELVCRKSVFPTVATEDSQTVYYKNDIFDSGEYKVNIIPFKNTDYKIKVDYKFNEVYTTKDRTETAIKSYLLRVLNTNLHIDYIKEVDIYNIIENLNLTGVDILNIDIIDSEGNEVPYIEVPYSRIPHLEDVLFPVTASELSEEGE